MKLSVSAHGCNNPFTGNILKTLTILHLLHTMQCLTDENHIVTMWGAVKSFTNSTTQCKCNIELLKYRIYKILTVWQSPTVLICLFLLQVEATQHFTQTALFCLFFNLDFVKETCFYCGSVCYTHNHKSKMKQKSNQFQIRLWFTNIYTHFKDSECYPSKENQQSHWSIFIVKNTYKNNFSDIQKI